MTKRMIMQRRDGSELFVGDTDSYFAVDGSVRGVLKSMGSDSIDFDNQLFLNEKIHKISA